jgi:NADH dehydrogenase
VTGAAGFIGRDLVDYLLSLGWNVKAFVRAGRENEIDAEERVATVSGDMCDASSLHEAIAGVGAVVHLAARKSDESDSDEVNVRGAERLIEACRKGGVRRIVNVSTQSVKLRRLGDYGRTKLEAERILHESGLDVTTLRPSVVYGPDLTGVFARMRHFLLHLPLIPIIGDGTWPSRPVYVRDVSKAIAACLSRDATIGEIYDLGGPDKVTMDEFLDAIGSAHGIRRPKLHIPKTLGLAIARVLARFVERPPVTVSNVLGSTQDTACDPSRAVKELGLDPVGLTAGLELLLDDEIRLRHRTNGRILKIAVVGLGKMGLFHSALLRTIAGVRLVAAADTNRGREASMRSMGINVPFFQSLEELLNERSPEAVLICTPTFAHYEDVKLCLERGVNVLVEKPLAANAVRSRDLAELAARQRVVHAVGYHLAYSPVFERARDLLTEGVIGEPETYRAQLQHAEVLGPKHGWMFDRDLAGGGLVRNTASHLIFLLEWFFGHPAQLTAKVGSTYSSSIEDTVTASLEYPNGTVGTIDASWSVPGKDILEVQMRVEGTRGSLTVTAEDIRLELEEPSLGFAVGRHRLHSSDLAVAGVFDLAPEASGAAYYRQDEGFISDITDGRQPRTAFDAAASAEEVIDAIYLSAENGEAVPLK